jgi:hypothetical protein
VIDKSIKTAASIKISKWISHLPKELKSAVRRDVILCGGAIASMKMNTKVNDYDLYFRTKSTAIAVLRYYIDQLSNVNKPAITVVERVVTNIDGESEDRIYARIVSDGIYKADSSQEIRFFKPDKKDKPVDMIDPITMEKMSAVPERKKKSGPEVKVITDNAVTLTDGIQLITRFVGEPSQIMKNFDFAHAACSYDYANDILDIPVIALNAMLDMRLVYTGSLYPVASVFRTRKFISRGFSVSAGEYLKMIWQINSIDLSEIDTLKEQLMGVDTAYMYQLVDALTLAYKEGDTVDSAYVMQKIDDIFN